MDLFTFAYGPCWEGCMAQLNLSLDKIIHPARDPSRPMPWWDKCRLYMHGRITSLIQQSQTIYHVSMDPYNRTEEMKWVYKILIGTRILILIQISDSIFRAKSKFIY